MCKSQKKKNKSKANLFNAAKKGNLERVMLLVKQGTDPNQTFGDRRDTGLMAAAENGHLEIIRFLVEQGGNIGMSDSAGCTPLIYASYRGHLEVVRYLLEQGANRDKANNYGNTSLHIAASNVHLETAKLLMVYGADLNARNVRGELPIDMTHTEEMKQAILDEPRRRMDEAPGKRCTEEDRHPNAATLASVQGKGNEEEDQHSTKKPRLEEGSSVAEEDQDSEPSDEEDDI